MVSGWKDQTWAWGATGAFPEDQNNAAAAAEGHFWEPISRFEKELEAGQGKQGLCDVERELGRGHIKNQGADAKGGMDVTEKKEGRDRRGKLHRGETLLIWGFVWLSVHA